MKRLFAVSCLLTFLMTACAPKNCNKLPLVQYSIEDRGRFKFVPLHTIDMSDSHWQQFTVENLKEGTYALCFYIKPGNGIWPEGSLFGKEFIRIIVKSPRGKTILREQITFPQQDVSWHNKYGSEEQELFFEAWGYKDLIHDGPPAVNMKLCSVDFTYPTFPSQQMIEEDKIANPTSVFNAKTPGTYEFLVQVKNCCPSSIKKETKLMLDKIF